MSASLDEIIANFDLLEEWDDRYRYLIELGRSLAPLPEEAHNEANKVRGCASQVWLDSQAEAGPGPQTRLSFLPISACRRSAKLPMRSLPPVSVNPIVKMIIQAASGGCQSALERAAGALDGLGAYDYNATCGSLPRTTWSVCRGSGGAEGCR